MGSLLGPIQLSCLSVFFGLLVGRAVHLKRTQGVNVFTIAQGKRGLPWIAELLFVPIGTAWTAEVVLYALGSSFRLFPSPLDSRLFDSNVMQAVGILCLVAALVLFTAALIAFGNSWRVGIDEDRPGDLVRSGVFAYSRNPIFVCMDLYLLGTFLVNGSAIFLLFAVLFAAGIHYQILQEERFLSVRYGAAYADYCRTTGRYFGGRLVPGKLC